MQVGCFLQTLQTPLDGIIFYSQRLHIKKFTYWDKDTIAIKKVIRNGNVPAILGIIVTNLCK